ncbi:hypothetical protein Pcinc_039723 [Petrolisthes cinctipes]|uniref:C2H2-type domain-containing protein n=1 Tax=Petrolisthes cinctipes TaxID=88211 RepID=A0AAE1EIU0_PETCI|nr:hypothetical protein Pcinc_039723 [Petrolisthes cinctipes]
MGYLACPVCERESLSNVRDLQLRVATALTRPLTCPICSATISGLQAFHHHLGAHLPAQPPSTPCDPATPGYQPTCSPEAIPTLENLDINDGIASPHSPSLTPHGPQDSPESMTGPSTQESSPAPTSDLVPIMEPSPAPAHNCDVCGLVFSSEYFLKIHKDIIHSKSSFFDVTCKLCKKKFKDLESYRNHVRESHSDRRYLCDQCPKTFKLRGSLVVHTRMFHDPSSPGACHTCSKTFTSRARRELHERRYHGRASPSGKASPTTSHHKTANSPLGDAKNWLETLMIENKPGGREEGGSGGGVTQPHTPATPHHPHIPSHFMPPPPQEMSHHSPEQLLSKGYQQLPPVETQAVIKTTPKETREQQEWSVGVQTYPSPQEHMALPQHKPPIDTYLAPYKTNIVFPCQVLQQNLGMGRSRHEYTTELKEEKKGIEMGSSCNSGRMIGSGHTQGSPVAVVSPQPHKVETPPVDTVIQEPSHCHTEPRRNSFPLVNPNKFSLIQSGDMARQHQTIYSSDQSMGECESGGAVGGLSGAGTGVGDKMGMGAHHQVYPQCHNIVPGLSSGAVGMLEPDTKAGLRVPPHLVLPGGTLYPSERLEECPDSPGQQPMDVHKDLATCEVRPIVSSHITTIRASRPEQRLEVTPVPVPVPTTPMPLVSAPNSVATNTIQPIPSTTRKDGGGNRTESNNKQWECEVCKKSFTTKYFLKKHKRLHTGETPYACGECGKTFTFQQSYHKHVLYHSDDKPHQCSYCGRAFKEMSTLHNHVRIHTGEKPFVCETCGKAFRQRVSYLVHQRIHTGVMPYTCTVCHRSFRYKVSLRSHKCEPSVGASTSTSTNTTTTITTTKDPQHHDTKPSTTTTTTNTTSTTSQLHLPRPSVTTTSTSTTTTTTSLPPQPPQPRVEMTSTACGPVTEELARAGQTDATGLQHTTLNNNNNNNNIHQDMGGGNGGRMRPPLETIDAAAISCDGMAPHLQDCKQFHPRQPHPQQHPHHHHQRPGPHHVIRAGGTHDPLSMAFLHALVDPNQARMHGECRPHHHHHAAFPPDTLPFPSLSPGTIDADMDHDSFLTNLLM